MKKAVRIAKLCHHEAFGGAVKRDLARALGGQIVTGKNAVPAVEMQSQGCAFGFP